MFKRIVLAALIASLVVPLAAQAPTGWKMRLDRSKSAQDPDDKSGVTFMAMGKGFHVAGGPAGVYWNPAGTATGNYTAKGTFTLLKPSNHTNYYGLVFGGQGTRRRRPALHVLHGRAGRHVPDQAAHGRSDKGHQGIHAQSRGQEAGRDRQVGQCARSARVGRHGHLRHQRHGRAHDAEVGAQGRNRWHRRVPREPRDRSAGRRLRGAEVVGPWSLVLGPLFLVRSGATQDQGPRTRD